MKQTLVVARHEAALLRSEPVPVMLYFIMPIVLLAFVEGAFTVFLAIESPGSGFSGADIAAPGQATMFGFMCLATTGYFFLGEHGWGTWNRLRALGVRPWQVMSGKLGVNYVEQLCLFVVVMTVGITLFDLHVRGSWPALVLIELLVAAVIVGYGLIACAVSSNQAQFNAFAYLGALVMAGLGGALTPFALLPGWAQAVAPATPTYWAIRAYRAVILDGGGFGDVTVEISVLLLFAVGFLALGSWLFDSNRRRSTWA